MRRRQLGTGGDRPGAETAGDRRKAVALPPLALNSLKKVNDQAKTAEVDYLLGEGLVSVLHLELPDAAERAGGGLLGTTPLTVNSENEAFSETCSRFARWCEVCIQRGVKFLWKEPWGAWLWRHPAILRLLRYSEVGVGFWDDGVPGTALQRIPQSPAISQGWMELDPIHSRPVLDAVAPLLVGQRVRKWKLSGGLEVLAGFLDVSPWRIRGAWVAPSPRQLWPPGVDLHPWLLDAEFAQRLYRLTLVLPQQSRGVCKLGPELLCQLSLDIYV